MGLTAALRLCCFGREPVSSVQSSSVPDLCNTLASSALSLTGTRVAVAGIAVGAPFVASRLSPPSRFLSAVSDTYPIHSSAAGVAVRSGHHCTQPLHRHLGINASARASLYIYSTATDVDRFITGLKESIEFFS